MTAQTHKIGSANAKLTVKTGRRGTAAKAGHDLEIEVGDWEATLELADPPGPNVLSLSADAGSLAVTSGTGGIMKLTEADKAEIKKTMFEEVLTGAREVEFRSTRADAGEDGTLSVGGDLTLNGVTHPLSFELVLGDGKVSGTAVVTQSEWGIKPYSGLFGTLKVADEVEVLAEAELA
jgi:polyisoprenoid-binding protein YceI